MSRFVTKNDVKEIHADWWDEAQDASKGDEPGDLPRETVTIRKYDVGRRDAMHAAILKITGSVGEPSEVEVKASQVPVLLAGIKSWTLRRPSGESIAPCNPEWIGHLGGEDADYIVGEIREFNPPARTEKEQDKF